MNPQYIRKLYYLFEVSYSHVALQHEILFDPRALLPVYT